MTNRPTFPEPTAEDIRDLTALRHDLHRHPELSGEEQETARRVCAMLEPTRPDRILSGLGGHGVAAIYDSGKPGPTVLFRAELDALPIRELGSVPYRSTIDGKAHLCGHDGHMAILLGFGRVLSRARPSRGRVVLMFQPAEENGKGAAAVVSDPAYDDIRPDWAFSLHNVPEIDFGAAKLGAGPTNCASRGMWIRLIGSTAHASRPDAGRSPMHALCELMPAMEACGGGAPLGPGFTMVTLTHAAMGAPSYGIAPGEATIFAALRTYADDGMDGLVARVETLAKETAERHGLGCEIGYDDIFLACTNDARATAHLAAGVTRAGLVHELQTKPSIGSEDFGRFGLAGAKSAMVYIGAGPGRPSVHTPKYDFLDDLIPIGIRIFSETLSDVLHASR
ncbi:MAG: peptidase M20 [Rhizobiaceae bacterium MnEN-MB40S]|nr:MAG: peptidase M20 [Rhizobiaceae bacterium MnEN-MB40S]